MWHGAASARPSADAVGSKVDGQETSRLDHARLIVFLVVPGTSWDGDPRVQFGRPARMVNFSSFSSQ